MIYSDEDLESAVQARVMTNDVMVAFRDYIAQKNNAAGGEQLRLTTGFNDILLAVSIFFVTAFVSIIPVTLPAFFPYITPDNNSTVSALIFAAFAWGLAEFFIRKHRMALSSIALLLAFIRGVVAACGNFSIWIGLNFNSMIILLICSFALAGMCYGLRFKVPMIVVGGVMAIVCVVILYFLPIHPA